MNDSTPAKREKDYLAKSLDVAIRLTLIAVVIISSFRIFGPFLPTLIWGAVIAIALYPVFEMLRRWVGGRKKLASGIFVIVAVSAVLVPTVILGGSLLDGTVRLVESAEDGTLEIPAPTERVREWPVIGEKSYQLWASAHLDLQGTMQKLQPQIGDVGRSVVGAVSSLGGALVFTILALIIAGIFMSTAEGANAASKVIARRVGGDTGPAMVDTAVGTIRSVVKGVILVALIQGLLSAVGMAIANVPAIGLWSLLVVVVAIIQLPPLLILLPVAVWVFANNDNTGISVFFLIWSLAVGVSDGILKPLLLGRGVEVPMLVILIGAIGGMLGAGVIGLFIGPVVLALAWELMMMWLEESREPASAGE